jgi:hypothetical protein
MRSRRFRYSGHPLTKAIDTAIDARKAAGHPVSTRLIADDLVSTVPAALMLTEFGRLVGFRVRSRLKARGEVVVNDSTWHRVTDVNVTDAEFHTTLDIKAEHLRRVQRRLKADTAVGTFLDKQAKRLGRPVTMGEFAGEIDHIYDHHGYTG